MTLKKNRAIKNAKVDVRFYPEEKEHLALLAQRAHISTSELVRRLATGAKLPDPSRYDAIMAIVRTNADLARLGNLLKMALDDKRTPDAKINRIINGLLADRNALKFILKNIQDHRKS